MSAPATETHDSGTGVPQPETQNQTQTQTQTETQSSTNGHAHHGSITQDYAFPGNRQSVIYDSAPEQENGNNSAQNRYSMAADTIRMSYANDEEQRRSYHVGWGPLAHVNTTDTQLPAFGGEMQPGLYRSVKHRKIANPAPLGLCAFALTTFILGLANMQARDITEPNIVVGAAFGYGGLVQLLAGMWYVFSSCSF